MVVLNWIKNSWTQHGTKWLGGSASFVAGVLSVPGLIEQGTALQKLLQIANLLLGILTVQRGFQNSPK